MESEVGDGGWEVGGVLRGECIIYISHACVKQVHGRESMQLIECCVAYLATCIYEFMCVYMSVCSPLCMLITLHTPVCGHTYTYIHALNVFERIYARKCTSVYNHAVVYNRHMDN